MFEEPSTLHIRYVKVAQPVHQLREPQETGSRKFQKFILFDQPTDLYSLKLILHHTSLV